GRHAAPRDGGRRAREHGSDGAAVSVAHEQLVLRGHDERLHLDGDAGTVDALSAADGQSEGQVTGRRRRGKGRGRDGGRREGDGSAGRLFPEEGQGRSARDRIRALRAVHGNVRGADEDLFRFGHDGGRLLAGGRRRAEAV